MHGGCGWVVGVWVVGVGEWWLRGVVVVCVWMGGLVWVGVVRCG